MLPHSWRLRALVMCSWTGPMTAMPCASLLPPRTCKLAFPRAKNRNDPASYDVDLYKKRHHVENCFEKLKRCRRIATRYDKTADSFMAFILIACCVLNLRKQF